MDEGDGLAVLVSHLKKLGHRNISYFGTDATAKVHRENILRAVCQREKLSVRAAAFVRVAGGEWEAGYQAIRERCPAPRRPTAVIAASRKRAARPAARFSLNHGW